MIFCTSMQKFGVGSWFSSDDRGCPHGISHPQSTTPMMTSSNGNIFRVTCPLCGEFTGPGEFPAQRPVTRSFDVFFDLRLNKRLSKQSWGWWFETLSWSLWRQYNASRRCLNILGHPLGHIQMSYWLIQRYACSWCFEIYLVVLTIQSTVKPLI